MANERTIAKPLSGTEVIDAILFNVREGFRKQAPKLPRKVVDIICDRLRAQMKKDCYLNPIIAYAGYASATSIRASFQVGGDDHYEFNAEIKINFQNTGTSIKETFIVVRGSQAKADETLDMQVAELHVSDKPAAPNAVRVETNQSVPAVVTTPQGKVKETRIKYAPKKEAAGRVHA